MPPLKKKKICFVCEDQKNLDYWIIYSKPRIRTLHVCIDCLSDLGVLYNAHANPSTQEGNCSLCREKINIIQWTDDYSSGVYLDIFRTEHGYYRICKPCFDQKINI